MYKPKITAIVFLALVEGSQPSATSIETDLGAFFGSNQQTLENTVLTKKLHPREMNIQQ